MDSFTSPDYFVAFSDGDPGGICLFGEEWNQHHDYKNMLSKTATVSLVKMASYVVIQS